MRFEMLNQEVLNKPENKAAEAMLNYTILESYKKFNDGNNAVIGKINLNELKEQFFHEIDSAEFHGDQTAEDYKQAFYDRFSLESNQEIPEELATKLLKIYNYESGVYEAGMQDEIQKTVISSEDNDAMVKIPKVYFNLPVEIAGDDKLKNKLEQDGVNVDGNNVYMIGMEKIDGDDLMTYMYKFILKEKGFDPEAINEMRFEQLEQNVGLYVKGGFNIPGGKGKDIYEKNFEAMQVSKENDAKVIELLKKDDFQLPKEVFAKLDRTIKFLHDENIYHRDLHSRNIMFDYNQAGEIKDTWLIDFASAKKFEGQPADPYNEDNASYVDDNYYQKFKVFAKSKVERESESENMFMTEIKNVLAEVMKRQATNPQSKTEYKELTKEIKAVLKYEDNPKTIISEVDRLLKFYSNSQVADPYVAKQLEVAMLEDFKQKNAGIINDDDLINCFEEERMNQKTPLVIHNFLTKYLEIKNKK